MTNIITLPIGDDFHTHLRQFKKVDELCMDARNLAPLGLQGGFQRFLAMPNLKPPITSTAQALEYQKVLEESAPGGTFLMSMYLCNDLSVEELETAHKAGVKWVKLYPSGVTTNSDGGVDDIEEYYPHFERMQELGMFLNIHAELPKSWAPESLNVFSMTAEAFFIPVLQDIISDFPDLKIVIEHVSSRVMVDFIATRDRNVGGTITAHHLLTILDDSLIDRSLTCKPTPKSPDDRQALLDVIDSGNKKFWLGSDSAPHPTSKKLSYACPCGVFSSLNLLPILVHIFEQNNMLLGENGELLNTLPNFISKYGREFYKLPELEGTVTLVRKPQKIPESIFGATPFLHGKTIDWSIK